MKKFLSAGLLLLSAIALTSADKGSQTMTKEKGVYVVNTTVIGKDVMGYIGPTPLKVYIRKNKIEKVEFLPNQETPKYWNAAKKHLAEKWNGMTVKKAKTAEVDGRTGATISSDAIKKNVKLAVEYYEKNK
ncbi:MAG: FMN-binding protein [Prevotella sp.]|jgi:electron transport complex protein RnfG|nr:FMN-binding protein [Prevotella sp.]